MRSGSAGCVMIPAARFAGLRLVRGGERSTMHPSTTPTSSSAPILPPPGGWSKGTALSSPGHTASPGSRGQERLPKML